MPTKRIPSTARRLQLERPARNTAERTYRQRVGEAAENIAVGFLGSQGLEILKRNFRRRFGELDIIARRGDVLIVAEVRTRASNRYGGAAASVDIRKQRRLIRTASQFLQQHRNLAHLRVRFDVITVSDIDNKNPRIDWIQHAFLA
jgi:putative endonuclease